MIRYRTGGISTSNCEKRVDKHLARIGKIQYIKGYRYQGKYGSTEAVMVKGENGTLRFQGFLWSYHGQGPRGLIYLLQKCGVDQDFAERIAFDTPRNYPNVGEDWRLIYENNHWMLRRPVTIYDAQMVMRDFAFA